MQLGFANPPVGFPPDCSCPENGIQLGPWSVTRHFMGPGSSILRHHTDCSVIMDAETTLNEY
jgi:hypothetical protein